MRNESSGYVGFGNVEAHYVFNSSDKNIESFLVTLVDKNLGITIDKGIYEYVNLNNPLSTGTLKHQGELRKKFFKITGNWILTKNCIAALANVCRDYHEHE